MIASSETIAGMLQRRISGLGFGLRQIAQVDFVVTEDHRNIMAYVYFDGDDYTFLCFDRPAMFDPSEVETMLIRGDLAASTLH